MKKVHMLKVVGHMHLESSPMLKVAVIMVHLIYLAVGQQEMVHMLKEFRLMQKEQQAMLKVMQFQQLVTTHTLLDINLLQMQAIHMQMASKFLH